MSEHLTVAETAKLVRQALKKAFPGEKFSVRSHTYTGGSSISVHWTDGPMRSEVDEVAEPLSGGRFVFTDRVFSDEFRSEMERQVVLLAGESGPFDADKRYSFSVGAQRFDEDGGSVAWLLGEVPGSELDPALEREAKRRADAAVARFNAAAGDPKTGFYVTVKDGPQWGTLLGPYATREAAEEDVKTGKRLAESVNSRAIWYAYGVTKVTMQPGADLPVGKLEHLTERQMALAEAADPVPQAA